uniref:Retinol binding protein 7 n=1 Tax=Sus scrofa TaxID=9823 RepID=A0A8D0WMK8_PIG
MPADLSGTWNLVSSDNFEGYMLALGIDFATRKIAKLLKPQKVIEQNGDSFTIHTNSSLRNYLVKFKVGEEFDEDNKGLDNRKCKSLVTWDNDRLTCVQKGEKKNRGWTHWIEGDELHLVLAPFCPFLYEITKENVNQETVTSKPTIPTLFFGGVGGCTEAYGSSQARGQVGAMQDPSSIFDIHHSSWQCWILNPLIEARDGTYNLTVTSQIASAVPRWELPDFSLIEKYIPGVPIVAQWVKNPV